LFLWVQHLYVREYKKHQAITARIFNLEKKARHGRQSELDRFGHLGQVVFRP
jgi:hypothetical protein